MEISKEDTEKSSAEIVAALQRLVEKGGQSVLTITIGEHWNKAIVTMIMDTGHVLVYGLDEKELRPIVPALSQRAIERVQEIYGRGGVQ